MRVPVTCTGQWFMPARPQASCGQEGRCHWSIPGYLPFTRPQECWLSGFRSYKEGPRQSLNSPQEVDPEPGDFLHGLLAYGLVMDIWGHSLSIYCRVGNKLSARPLVQVFVSGGDPGGVALGDCVQPGYRVTGPVVASWLHH